MEKLIEEQRMAIQDLLDENEKEKDGIESLKDQMYSEISIAERAIAQNCEEIDHRRKVIAILTESIGTVTP